MNLKATKTETGAQPHFAVSECVFGLWLKAIIKLCIYKTNEMQFWTVFIYFTANSLYMFRVSPARIIRNTQTVVTTTGTSHEFGECIDKILLKRVYGRADDLYQWL
jgi:hypothetical protein